MQALGMQSAEDVCSVSGSKVTKHILASTPVFRMHTLLQHTYWEDVGWEFQQAFPWGKLIAQVVRDWRQSDAAKPVPACVKAALELASLQSHPMVPLIG